MFGIELQQLDELLRLGFMLEISGAGCPAATTTTSTVLSPQLDQRVLVLRSCRSLPDGPLNIIRKGVRDQGCPACPGRLR